MNDNIEKALSIIANEAFKCLNANEISKCIEIEYCYNTIAIECEVDKRMHLHRVIEADAWALSILTSDDYYKEVAII